MLYALGQHDALQRAASGLHAGDTLMAFLDDLYIVTAPSRARTALDAATQAVADHCGIGSNLGKTRAMAAKEGPPPPGWVTMFGAAISRRPSAGSWCPTGARRLRPSLDRRAAAGGTPSA